MVTTGKPAARAIPVKAPIKYIFNCYMAPPLTPAVFFTLFALSNGEKHGYAIMQETEQLSGGKFHMGPGTLYTTIQRLWSLGLITEVEGAAEGDPRRRYYRLTEPGKSLLDLEIGRMRDLVTLAKGRKVCES
jgi:DNA-binding PadR family transcriptional regulator